MDARDLRISSPCTVDWESMTPADGGRFCGDCKKVVRNLSQMTEREARALLAKPRNEGLCVRLLHDKHGKVFFADSAPQGLLPAALLQRAKRVATAAGLALPLAACSLPDSFSAAFSDTETPSAHDEELQPLQGGVAYDPRDDERDPGADAGADARADTDAESDAQTDTDAQADASPSDTDAGPADEDAGDEGPY